MVVQQLTANSWRKQRAKFLNFISRHSNKRIAISTFNRLRQLQPDELTVPESKQKAKGMIVTMISQKQCLGIAFFHNDDPKQCLIVVHPTARSQGIGEALLSTLIHYYKGQFICHVATDNTSSLKLCFKCGLHATQILKGPTGKPTLCFERSKEHATEASRNINSILEQ